MLHKHDEQGNLKSHKIYASTDLTLPGIDIFIYYKARFRIEFLYRNAKQFTGLEDGQSRSGSKIHFYFNTALATVLLAKVIYHLNQPLENRNPFSMVGIKTQYFKSVGLTHTILKLFLLKINF